MLDIMKRLPEKYHLICLGEGPLLIEIQQTTACFHLEKRVHFLGFRRDVADLLNTADISVIPSIWEGFGLVAVEAMACGKPIVATDVPGLSEVVGNAGVKVPYGEVERFTQAILDIDLNESRNEARKQAERYNLKTMVKKYIAVYIKCLEEADNF